MKCSICGRKLKKLYTCEECDEKFCDKCGDVEREWCDMCLKFEEAQKNNESIDT